MYGTQQATAPFVPQVANSLVPGDQIIVSLTAQDNRGKNLSFSHTFDSEGRQTDNAGRVIAGARGLDLAAMQIGGQEPQFPTAQYVQLLKENKKAEADQLTVNFKAQVDGYRGRGGAAFTDLLARAIYRFLEVQHNVKPTQQEGLVLDPAAVNVRAPTRQVANQPGLWVAMLAPVWG